MRSLCPAGRPKRKAQSKTQPAAPQKGTQSANRRGPQTQPFWPTGRRLWPEGLHTVCGPSCAPNPTLTGSRSPKVERRLCKRLSGRLFGRKDRLSALTQSSCGHTSPVSSCSSASPNCHRQAARQSISARCLDWVALFCFPCCLFSFPLSFSPLLCLCLFLCRHPTLLAPLERPLHAEGTHSRLKAAKQRVKAERRKQSVKAKHFTQSLLCFGQSCKVRSHAKELAARLKFALLSALRALSSSHSSHCSLFPLRSHSAHLQLSSLLARLQLT